MRPKEFNNNKKDKIVETTQQDLGLYTNHETKITTMGLKGKDIASTSYSNCLNDTQYENKNRYFPLDSFQNIPR